MDLPEFEDRKFIMNVKQMLIIFKISNLSNQVLTNFTFNAIYITKERIYILDTSIYILDVDAITII